MILAQLLLAYLAAGAVIALAFAIHGATRLLPDAQVSIGARLLLVPGAFLLWPLIAWRWLSRAPGPGGADTNSEAPHP